MSAVQRSLDSKRRGERGHKSKKILGFESILKNMMIRMTVLEWDYLLNTCECGLMCHVATKACRVAQYSISYYKWGPTAVLTHLQKECVDGPDGVLPRVKTFNEYAKLQLKYLQSSCILLKVWGRQKTWCSSFVILKVTFVWTGGQFFYF